MQKKILAALLLAALLLTVGCAEDAERSTASVSAEPSFAESTQTSETVISLPEESSVEESFETSSGAIELPSAPEFVLTDSLRFCPDEGWEQTGENVFTSADGTQTVRADLVTLPDPKNITEALLVSDALQTLPDAIAQTGAELLTIESVALAFSGTEHTAVSLVTSKDGKTVYQQQLYLLYGENVLLLTVTAQNEDRRETLWSYFKDN